VLHNRYAHHPSLTLSQSVLSSGNERWEFLDIGDNSGQNTLATASLVEQKTGVLRDVEARAGPSYCSEASISRISLLKIDTEGWDF